MTCFQHPDCDCLGACQAQSMAELAAKERGLVRLTKEQAAIIGAFTGVTCGPFSDVHQMAERVLKRPIFTHQFASEDFLAELQRAVREDFMAIAYQGEGGEA